MPANDDLASVLWLYMNRDVPRFLGLGQVIDERYLERAAELNAMLTAFDLDTAVGAQLDVLGAQVFEPRLGLDDSEYRAVIRVRYLILSSQGTSGLGAGASPGQGPTSGLIQIWEAVTGEAPTDYSEVYPHHVTIAGVVASTVEEDLLRSSLDEAKPGGRVLTLIGFASANDVLIWEHEGDPGAGQGVLDHEGDPVAGAGLLAHAF